MLNERLDEALFDYSVNFLCDGIAYNSISRRILKGSIRMYYGSTEVMFDSGSWKSQIYRTIIFSAPPTGDLLTWLQNNGVKQ
nr:MAG TPA: hypothetical protein [Caudoviricetes sp.]